MATARTLLLDQFGLTAIGSLGDHGVESLLLKGPSTAAWLYPGELRLYGDIDLLVSPDSIEVAEEVLTALDLADRRVGPQAAAREKSRPWSAAGSALVIDLHQGLEGVETDDRTTWSVLWRHREPLHLGPVAVQALDEPARALHVVLHAAQHKRHDKPLRDLRRALDRVGTETWREAVSLSRELDAIDAFTDGLHLVGAGQLLARELSLGPSRSVHVALRAGDEPGTAHGIEQLRSARGFRPKVELARQRILPPAEVLRLRSSLARRGRVGLTLAYAGRALGLTARGIPAAGRWYRARRAVEASAGEPPTRRSGRRRGS